MNLHFGIDLQISAKTFASLFKALFNVQFHNRNDI